jgi:hypothetical protein
MKKVLPVIVVSQFLCTSLWFAGNAIMPDIAQRYYIEPSFLAHITSAVQLGFITGTLAFAIVYHCRPLLSRPCFFYCIDSGSDL